MMLGFNGPFGLSACSTVTWLVLKSAKSLWLNILKKTLSVCHGVLLATNLPSVAPRV
jgi:hypothetical protein